MSQTEESLGDGGSSSDLVGSVRRADVAGPSKWDREMRAGPEAALTLLWHLAQPGQRL